MARVKQDRAAQLPARRGGGADPDRQLRLGRAVGQPVRVFSVPFGRRRQDRPVLSAGAPMSCRANGCGSARINTGEAFQYFFFWGHTPPKDDTASKSCLSQWFPAPFTIAGVTYRMMTEKARLFGDPGTLARIFQAPSPKVAKAFGREVQNFDAPIWLAKCFEIVVNGNVQKFQQNPAMRDFLVSTGNTLLVEAAPRDQIWGIGLGEHNERARDPAQWRGRNLLGFALTEVRTRLRAT